MNLYIMRHGMAEPYHVRPDEERALVAEGESQVRSVAQRWQADAPALGTIIVSPYKRAQQTAAIVKGSLDFSEALHTESRITPEGDVQEVVQYLSQLGIENTLVVSHMPLVGGLISYLTAGDYSSFGGLMTGQLVQLRGEQLDRGCMQIEHVLYPQ
ncbi:MAG: phosphohistidine phosphatase SixA [Gammaproteobacteria bacterium]|nr:phosphohistidine phosphatase SixA [Gammaproteobacteria bacterium]